MSYLKTMKTRSTTRKASHGDSVYATPVEINLIALRNNVRDALLAIPVDERSTVRDRILDSLTKAGVELGTLLVLLGISARTADELTPSDLAHLVGYVRVVTPAKYDAIAPEVAQLLSAGEKVKRVHETRKAA